MRSARGFVIFLTQIPPRASRVTPGLLKAEVDDDDSPIRRTRRRREVTMPALTAHKSQVRYHEPCTMCFGERICDRVRKKNSASLRGKSPLSHPLATPIEFDRGANSRSVTSRCLRIKYHCPGQLDRTAPFSFSLSSSQARHWTFKVAPGGKTVQRAIYATDPAP